MKYCIIIDAQNDFCTGALANPAFEKIVPAIAAKAKELKEKGYKIIATRDTHFENYMETQEGKNLPVPHCLVNTDGWEVADEIKPYVDLYVNKKSFGYADWKPYDMSFLGNYLPKDKRDEYENPDEIIICGTVTEICVISNATILKAAYPEIPITVYKDLCAGLDNHEAALNVMKSMQINVI